MSMSSGLRIDLRIKGDVPQAIIGWLSQHVMNSGNMSEINAMFKKSGKGDFEDWGGGTLRRSEDESHWHLKSNASATSYERKKIAFFLNELQPWVIMEPGRLVATLVGEEHETREYLFWYNEQGEVHGCYGRAFGYSDSHPQYASAETLAEPLPMYDTCDIPKWEKPEHYNFGKRATVSIKGEKKRILARQHNEKYAKPISTDEAAELAAMEQGL